MDAGTYFALSVGFISLLCALYLVNPIFRYKVRMGLFYAYLLVISFIALPVTLLRGRCTENLATISWMMNPARKLFGIKSEILNWEKNMIRDRPCIIVSNHQSSLDVFGMAEMYPPRASFMAKHTLLYTGAIGLVLWLCGGVFINRARHKSAQDVLNHTVEEINERKLKLWIFPEGTRGHGGGMLPFKKGAFNLAVLAKIPIVPVVFKAYADDFYCKRKYIFKPGKYVAEVLPPVSTDGMSVDDVPVLCDNVREQMLNTYYRLSGIKENNN